MLTKYILHTSSVDHILQPDELKNWDEIKVSYSRPSFDGVVRSFSSQFEFANAARDLLLGIYLRDRFAAQVVLEVQVIQNDWTWKTVFSCPLDFSTVTFDNTTLSINALDNSLSALIKANKGTKYEFAIGRDIMPENTFHYDRLPMLESATYELTQGIQYDNGDIGVTFRRDELPYIGNVASEISVGHAVYWRDDQNNDLDSSILEAVNDITLTIEYSISWLRNGTSANGAYLYICTKTGQYFDWTQGRQIATLANTASKKIGNYTSSTQLPDAEQTHEANQNQGTLYALVGDIVWELQYRVVEGRGTYEWYNTEKDEREYFISSTSGKFELTLKARQALGIVANLTSGDSTTIRIVQSKFTFSWKAKGQSCNIDAIKPITALNALLRKVTDGKINASGEISTRDSRIAKTWLLPAESVRGIEGAKFYSSFTEFCDWMQTVFGYVYTLGEVEESRFIRIKEAGAYKPDNVSQIVDEELFYYGDIETSRITYSAQLGKFFYRVPNTAQMYSKWTGSNLYNDPTTGKARTDSLYRIAELGEGLWYMTPDKGLPAFPVAFNGTEETMRNPFQAVKFVHRSELFGTSRRRTIANVNELKYEVDSSMIYSSVNIGYEKKDYDSINGRDEFNFNNTYSTGCSVSDKQLSLISKYRADCYGIEFATQKRGEDTTDSNADNDVFFVLAKSQPYTDEQGNTYNGLVPDRTARIQGALNDSLFNGDFSPLHCVDANTGYITLMADFLKLSFASSEGNSEIRIDGRSMGMDFTINDKMATNGTIEFICGDVDDIADTNQLISVTSGETTYRGYIKSVDIAYSKEEQVKYKLIVKDITQ